MLSRGKDPGSPFPPTIGPMGQIGPMRPPLPSTALTCVLCGSNGRGDSAFAVPSGHCDASRSAPEGRKMVAHGASRGTRVDPRPSPVRGGRRLRKGRSSRPTRVSYAPDGACRGAAAFPRLTPWATLFRPHAGWAGPISTPFVLWVLFVLSFRGQALVVSPLISFARAASNVAPDGSESASVRNRPRDEDEEQGLPLPGVMLLAAESPCSGRGRPL